MSKDKCKLSPTDVEASPHRVWFYENPGKLEFIVQPVRDGLAQQSFTFSVSRRQLAASLKRMNASRKRKVKP